MKQIIVLGTKGQLGRCFYQIKDEFPEIEMHFLSRNDFNIATDDCDLLLPYRADWIINCAAYTLVDMAEKDQDDAFLVNADGPARLAEFCKKEDIQLIHFSTDYVYHNALRRPLLEGDPCLPQGIYAKSKLQGEKNIFGVLDKAIILRVSWLYSPFKKNFFTTMKLLLSEREQLNIVNDQIGCPTYAIDLARACANIIGKDLKRYGVFNFSNAGILSWFDFAMTIKYNLELKAKINPIPTEQYPTPALRPAYSVMDKNSFYKNFAIPLMNWKRSLFECIKLSQNEN